MFDQQSKLNFPFQAVHLLMSSHFTQSHMKKHHNPNHKTPIDIHKEKLLPR